MNPLFLIQVIFALGDYALKAIRAYQETEAGRAEWLDVEAAYERATGDTVSSEKARAEAQNIRRNQDPQGVSRGRDTASTRINLNE